VRGKSQGFIGLGVLGLSIIVVALFVGVITFPGFNGDVRSKAQVMASETVTLSVQQAGDIINEDGSKYDYPPGEKWIGTGETPSASYLGIRFTGATISKGAQVQSAKIEFSVPRDQWIGVEYDIYGDNSVSSAPFSESSKPSSRGLTSIKTSINEDTQWKVGKGYEVDVTGVVGELVGSGEHSVISFILRGTGGSWGRKFINNDPRLVITYTPGSGEATSVPTPTNSPSPIVTASPTIRPTVTPRPTTSTSPSPTPTATTMSGMGKCGEPMDRWHAPVYNGCETGHEHGDPPSSWILAAGYNPMFHGHFNTSAAENSIKHTSMKGFSTRMDGVDIYFRTHFASNPQERFGAYHSYEVWTRDASGSVSHWQGWNYSGRPTSNLERFARRSENGDPGVRPIILVTDQTSLDQGIGCEQWYASTASWSWDFGITICGSTTVYQRNLEQTAADAFNQSIWRLTGDLGLTRRLEAAWYGPNSQYSPNRGNPPKDRAFWTTQFGRIVSGPNDPICTGTSVGLDGVTYNNVCLEQYIASTMTSVEFPGNAVQKTFSGTGVMVPN